jgi:hypothetical protein
MAPILSTAIGVTPQIIDDPRLRQLLNRLDEFEPNKVSASSTKPQSAEEVIAPLDITKLVSLLEPYQTWIFEEQVRLAMEALTSLALFSIVVMPREKALLSTKPFSV